MGVDEAPHPEDGESLARSVELSEFHIAPTPVSNAEFSAFVEATGYRTIAEVEGISQVFQAQLESPERHELTNPEVPWWRTVRGASWRAPLGANSLAIPDLPVVHVSWFDALEFCKWAACRLPSEAEWEKAARGGLEGQSLPLAENEIYNEDLNIWQGKFPNEPQATVGPKSPSDGKPNGYGLVHTSGNVWEWTADGFSKLQSPRPQKNPSGALNARRKVVKGGSFLCHDSYCGRYRNFSRRGEIPEMAASNLGFRVVRIEN